LVGHRKLQKEAEGRTPRGKKIDRNLGKASGRNRAQARRRRDTKKAFLRPTGKKSADRAMLSPGGEKNVERVNQDSAKRFAVVADRAVKQKWPEKKKK